MKEKGYKKARRLDSVIGKLPHYEWKGHKSEHGARARGSVKKGIKKPDRFLSGKEAYCV
mgnify:FL=1